MPEAGARCHTGRPANCQALGGTPGSQTPQPLGSGEEPVQRLSREQHSGFPPGAGARGRTPVQAAPQAAASGPRFRGPCRASPGHPGPGGPGRRRQGPRCSGKLPPRPRGLAARTRVDTPAPGLPRLRGPPSRRARAQSSVFLGRPGGPESPAGRGPHPRRRIKSPLAARRLHAGAAAPPGRARCSPYLLFTPSPARTGQGLEPPRRRRRPAPQNFGAPRGAHVMEAGPPPPRRRAGRVPPSPGAAWAAAGGGRRRGPRGPARGQNGCSAGAPRRRPPAPPGPWRPSPAPCAPRPGTRSPRPGRPAPPGPGARRAARTWCGRGRRAERAAGREEGARRRRSAGRCVSLAPSRPAPTLFNRGRPRADTPHGLTAWLRRPGQ